MLWAGERLALEKAVPGYLREGRPISVSAVPLGPGIDIWKSCRFLGGMLRALRDLPGGVLQGSCLARWVRITVGFSISGENNVDTGVLIGLNAG